MKGLNKYRIIHLVRYNSRAERDHETWIVEELSKGLPGIGPWWSEHKEKRHGEPCTIKFKEFKLANEYVERLLDGNPRNTVIRTVVSERE